MTKERYEVHSRRPDELRFAREFAGREFSSLDDAVRAAKRLREDRSGSEVKIAVRGSTTEWIEEF